MVDDIEYGRTKEYKNFAFTIVHSAGHKVPYYQPAAALQIFNRTIWGLDLATGMVSNSDVQINSKVSLGSSGLIS